MKFYTYLTDSHKMFLNTFVSTFPFEIGLDLEIKYLPQICKSGVYLSDNWGDLMKEKIKFILEIIDNKPDEHFVFSDIDVQFFGNIKDDLLHQIKDLDILFQDDYDSYCSGFFISKKNSRTYNFFRSVMLNIGDREQNALNHVIKTSNIYYRKLSRRYWTIGEHQKIWNGEDFDVPKDILVHHANWTVGIENKLNLLKLVREKVTNP